MHEKLFEIFVVADIDCLVCIDWNALAAGYNDRRTYTRRVDLLSDVRMPEPDKDEAEADSLPPVPVVKPAFVDTCRSGMTCIEDYSDSTMRGMTPFIVPWTRFNRKAGWCG